MNIRQKRLIEVYEHLRKHCGIHTKTDFAKAVKYGRTSMSAALNGNEAYLTDSLFRNICDAYPGVFSLDYLLDGNGELLAGGEPKKPEAEQPPPANEIDHGSLVNAALAAKDDAIIALKRESAVKDDIIEALRREAAAREEAISALKELTASKDETISSLRHASADLRAALADLRARLASQDGYYHGYPFRHGVAEAQNEQTKNA